MNKKIFENSEEVDFYLYYVKNTNFHIIVIKAKRIKNPILKLYV